MDKIEEIKKLKLLLDQGVITEEEFETLKKKIIPSKTDDSEGTKKKVSQSYFQNGNGSEVVKATSVVKNSPKKKSNTVKKPIKRKKQKEYQYQKSEEFQLFLYFCILIGFITSLTLWIRYDNSILFFVTLSLTIGLTFIIPKLVPKLWQSVLLLLAQSVLLILLIAFPIGNTSSSSSESSSSSTDDRAVLHCKWCKETIYEQGNEGIVCYTDEQGGCAWVKFYGGTKYAFCSERCCVLYRSIK